MGQSVRRRISSILGGKKKEPSSGALSPIINANAGNDQVLRQRVLIESLRKQTRDLEDERETRRQVLQQIEGKFRDKEAELQRLQQSHAELEKNNKRLEEEKETLNKHVARLHDLEAALKEYRILAVKSAEEKRTQQQTIATLQAEKAELERLANLPDPVLTLQLEKARLAEQAKQLQDELAQERSERKEQDQEIERTTIKGEQLTKWIEELSEELETTKSEANRDLGTLAKQIEEERRKHRANLKEEKDSRVLDIHLTPRVILMNSLFCHPSRREIVGMTEEEARVAAAPFLQSCSPAMLTNQHLDIRLTRLQAKRLRDSLAFTVGEELSVKRCWNCRQRKLALRPGTDQPGIRVDEFAGSSQRRQCCWKWVCSDCCVTSLTQSLTTDWWLNGNNPNWLVCPAFDCRRSAEINDRTQLETLLGELKDQEMDKHLDMWDRSEAFRTAIGQLVPALPAAAVRRASALHSHLVSLGCMYSLFDPAFRNPSPDEKGYYIPFDTGSIRIVSVDDETGNSGVDVPIFTQFFKKSQGPKQCPICADDYFEFDVGASAEEWLQKCKGFQGKWMWDILSFPLKLGLNDSGCQHPIDFCTTCLQTHLKSQLEQRGRGGSGQLLCMAVECRRKLDYHEIQLYAEPETFAQYDKYLYLDTLSRLPNFRWCLGPNCTNGQLYDDDDGPLEPHYSCDECGFGMCFTHAMPWHQGLTCDQYDSQRTHGDPDFQQTQDWIRDNTKPCPGCGQNIQKGEYCFHMTCTNCRFEFCWECLAD